MLTVRIALVLPLILCAGPQETGEAPRIDARIARGVEHLRHAQGNWRAETQFMNEDGGGAGSAEGTYSFHWVVPDRVLVGESEFPSLGSKSAILFYVNVDKLLVEMSSVGADGDLWVMAGPIDGEVRSTASKVLPDKSTIELRFTRSAVEPDRFESRMEFSSDHGKTWKLGNHQVFTRGK